MKSHESEDIYERINAQIKSIESSIQFYRSEAKADKLAVLNAALQYLTQEIDLPAFRQVLTNHPKYADAVGTSTTKNLIDEALKTVPDPYRTKEGYMF